MRRDSLGRPRNETHPATQADGRRVCRLVRGPDYGSGRPLLPPSGFGCSCSRRGPRPNGLARAGSAIRDRAAAADGISAAWAGVFAATTSSAPAKTITHTPGYGHPPSFALARHFCHAVGLTKGLARAGVRNARGLSRPGESAGGHRPLPAHLPRARQNNRLSQMRGKIPPSAPT